MVIIAFLVLNGVYSSSIASDPTAFISKTDTEESIRMENDSESIINKASSELKLSSITLEDFIPSFTGKMSSGFGMRTNPVTHRVRPHEGMDLPSPRGTPIYAPAIGVVIFSGMKNGFGNVIVIDHQNGYKSLIAHNMINYAKVGDWVDKDTLIGLVGATGRATGFHRHIEVFKNNKEVNPVLFWKP
jgi:murein DD-endopeptidase MepM/ murein hydrolase activator NlpD